MSVIAVWGKNGSGRSTIAVNLAAHLAKKGSLVGLVGANKTYGSLQYYLGMEIPEEKSLKNALEVIDEDELVQCFVQHPKVKDLFVLGLSNRDNCLKLRTIKEDAGKRLLLNTKDKFDYYIIDCTETFTDTLTTIGCQYADVVLEVIRPTVQAAAFRTSQEELLESIRLKHKVISIANCNKNLIKLSDFEHKAKVRFSAVLPYSRNVESSENTAEPVILLGPSSRADKEFIKGISRVADLIENRGLKSEEKNEDNSTEKKKGITFIKIKK